MRQQKRSLSSVFKESSIPIFQKSAEQQPSKKKSIEPTVSRLEWLGYILRHIFELEKLLKQCMANLCLFANVRHISYASRQLLVQLDECKNSLCSETEKSIAIT